MLECDAYKIFSIGAQAHKLIPAGFSPAELIACDLDKICNLFSYGSEILQLKFFPDKSGLLACDAEKIYALGTRGKILQTKGFSASDLGQCSVEKINTLDDRAYKLLRGFSPKVLITLSVEDINALYEVNAREYGGANLAGDSSLQYANIYELLDLLGCVGRELAGEEV